MTETVNRLYSMPIELRDDNFVGLVTRPFTHEEHLDALRSLGFMNEDIEKWEPPNITEFELPDGFNPETETKRVIHLTANRQVFMVDEDWIDYWPQRTITIDEANATFEADSPGSEGITIHQRRDDPPNPWRIQVRGHPARRESISWREAIRDAVTDTYPQAPFTSPPSGTKFTVEVIFRMTPEDLARPAFDLDNFAKPVLDTLFTSQNVSRLTGVLLPGVNDTWVFRLLLEKVEVKTPQEQGADITVTWHPSVTPDLSTS